MFKTKILISVVLYYSFGSILFASAPEFHILPANELNSWEVVGSSSFSEPYISYTSLGFDNNDIAYVTYQGDASPDYYQPNVMKYSSSSWNHVGDDTNIAVDEAYDLDIAFDSTNTPYVVFTDSGNDYKITVVKFDGVNWTKVGGVDVSTGDNDSDCVIDIDSNDNIYVAYKDSSLSDKLTVKKYNGSSWSVVGSAGFTPGDFGIRDVSIALASDNTPYVAFKDRGGASGGEKGMVVKFNGANWIELGNLDFNYPVLTIDSNNIVYVAPVYNTATVKKFVDANSTWVVVGNTKFSAGNVSDLSIAVDSQNRLYVGYQDKANGNKATVMTYNGSSWVNVGNAGFSANKTKENTIAIDSNDVPYMFFAEYTNSDKATVMKYIQNIQYSVLENTTAVGDINATDPENDPITYTISGTDSAFFDINSSTGILNFKVAPNYEIAQDSGANNIYDITVTISANGDFISKDIQVNVTDDPDNDADGIENSIENTNATDIDDADSDNDGLSDAQELIYSTNPLDADSDDDGLTDGEEVSYLTNPLEDDTDSDNLNDGLEMGRTSPIVGGLSDGNAIAYTGTALGWIADSDNTTTTNPLKADSDLDTLVDGLEDFNTNGSVDIGETDPNKFDSDGDGVGDAVDQCEGYDDNNDTDGDSIPTACDTDNNDGPLGDPDNDLIPNQTDDDDDGDGMPDSYENNYGFNLLDASDANLDADTDGYTNLQEYKAGTDPTNDMDYPIKNISWIPAIIMYLLH